MYAHTTSLLINVASPSLKVCPHLYANANGACGTEANPNKCQKVVCLASA